MAKTHLEYTGMCLLFVVYVVLMAGRIRIISAVAPVDHFVRVFGGNQKAVVAELTTFTGATRIQCAGVCMKGGCTGFNFKKQTASVPSVGTCQLLGAEAGLSNMVSEIGNDYYEKLDARYCSDPSVCVIVGGMLYPDDALDKCPRIYPGSHLVDIQDEQENTALTNVARSRGWTAYLTSGRRLASGALSDLYWMNTNMPINYTNWLPNNPQKITDDDNCIIILASSGKWNDAKCAAKRNYICQNN